MLDKKPRLLSPRVSRKEIRQAIDALRAEGLEPTIARVRAKLGRGSFTTIANEFRRWHVEQFNQLAEVPPLVDDKGREFLLSKQFVPSTSGAERRVATLVINGVVMTIDDKTALDLIAHKASAEFGDDGKERMFTLNVKSVVRFLGSPDLEVRLGEAMSEALAK